MSVLSCDRVRELLDYDQLAGVLTWKVRPSNRVHVGDKAGVVGFHGYVILGIDGKRYRAHRVCWLHHYGWLPDIDIDHIDGDRANNSLSNLRVATRSQNNANSKLRANNKLGVKGVSFDRSRGQYFAYVGKKKLGRFDSLEDAKHAYEQEAVKVFGEYARF